MSDKKLKIVLTKSTIGSQKEQIANVKGLGLKKLNSFVIKAKTLENTGMVRKVNHLIKIEDQ